MACGTPVIAFNRGSVPEIIEDGLTGFVVEGKEEAVAAIDCLSRLLSRRYSAALRGTVHGTADGARISYRISQPHRETAIPTVATTDYARRWSGRRVSRATLLSKSKASLKRNLKRGTVRSLLSG